MTLKVVQSTIITNELTKLKDMKVENNGEGLNGYESVDALVVMSLET